MHPAIPDEQAALLAGIVARPDDDTARLVYADWLQEHGDERQAQYIRDAIALDRLSPYEDVKREQLGQRLDKIADARGANWLRALGVIDSLPHFDRGMLFDVNFDSANAFLACAQVLLTRTPIQHLGIEGDGFSDDDLDWLSRMAELPNLHNLRSLTLSNCADPFSAEAWAWLVSAPQLSELESLSVKWAALTDTDALVLVERASMRRLRELDLSENYLTVAGALAVVRSRHFAGLERISLNGNAIEVDRTRGSDYLALRDELFERFGNAGAIN